jgi:hypothetical protein
MTTDELMKSKRSVISCLFPVEISVERHIDGLATLRVKPVGDYPDLDKRTIIEEGGNVAAIKERLEMLLLIVSEATVTSQLIEPIDVDIKVDTESGDTQ